MKHTIKIRNKADGNEVEHAIDCVHMEQIKILAPFLEATTPVTIPWEIDGPIEEQAMAAMLNWVKRESELKVKDMRG